jgi:hypothetical protein
VGCFTKHFNNFWVLAAGRVLCGIATSLLFSAFESWLVAEHFKVGAGWVLVDGLAGAGLVGAGSWVLCAAACVLCFGGCSLGGCWLCECWRLNRPGGCSLCRMYCLYEHTDWQHKAARTARRPQAVGKPTTSQPANQRDIRDQTKQPFSFHSRSACRCHSPSLALRHSPHPQSHPACPQRGYAADWLGNTFSQAVFLGNGLMAIMSGGLLTVSGGGWLVHVCWVLAVVMSVGAGGWWVSDCQLWWLAGAWFVVACLMLGAAWLGLPSLESRRVTGMDGWLGL